MPSIFVSYRRGDEPAYAGRLYDRFVERFGKANVFKDVDSTEPGADFGKVIEAAIAECDALVAVIGPKWRGRRRLFDPEDWVRYEIVNALQRNIRVIPVLVNGGVMPSAARLPEDLRPLARRQAFELVESVWATQLEALLTSLETAVERQKAVPVDEQPAVPVDLPVEPAASSIARQAAPPAVAPPVVVPATPRYAPTRFDERPPAVAKAAEPRWSTGHVKSWSESQGTGSIAPERAGPDVHVERRVLDPDARRTLIEHELVWYKVGEGQGPPHAIAVKPLSRDHMLRRNAWKERPPFDVDGFFAPSRPQPTIPAPIVASDVEGFVTKLVAAIMPSAGGLDAVVHTARGPLLELARRADGVFTVSLPPGRSRAAAVAALGLSPVRGGKLSRRVLAPHATASVIALCVRVLEEGWGLRDTAGLFVEWRASA